MDDSFCLVPDDDPSLRDVPYKPVKEEHELMKELKTLQHSRVLEFLSEYAQSPNSRDLTLYLAEGYNTARIYWHLYREKKLFG